MVHPWPNWSEYFVICPQGLRKTMGALRILGVAAKSRRGHLPNTGQTRYITAQLLATSCFSAVTTVHPLRCPHTFFRKLPERLRLQTRPDPTASHQPSGAEYPKACATHSMSQCSIICATNISRLKERRASTILVRFPVGARYFSLLRTFIPALGPTQPPIRWVSKALPILVKRPGV